MELKELISNFQILESWEDKYSYLIDLGKTLPNYPEEDINDTYKIEGCTSGVWLKIIPNKNSTLQFIATSDAQIVKGLIFVLMTIYNNQPINEIKNINVNNIFKELGLEDNITPNRRNGFFAMVKKLTNF